MANTGFVDVCRFNATSTGTGDFVVASAVTGYQTPALAGATNGTQYRYRAETLDLSQWEVGYGTYTSGSVTLARTTVLYNSSGTGTGAGQSGAGTKINFSAIPRVGIVFLAEDFNSTGQIPGTQTNDSASAGNIGEFMICGGAALTSATVTMTIATPCVVTWTGHPLTNYAAVTFTTSGALPTGVTSGTTYYAIVIDANTFNIATSVDNAIAGTKVNTSGSQSGTHTGTNSANLVTATAKDIGGLSLTAGNWFAAAAVFHDPGATTNFTFAGGSINTTSNTLSNLPGRGFFIRYPAAGVVPAGGFGGEGIGPTRFSLSATTTIYLNAFDIFTVSTDAAYGVLIAWRPR